jgi:hypothetical protein
MQASVMMYGMNAPERETTGNEGIARRPLGKWLAQASERHSRHCRILSSSVVFVVFFRHAPHR